MASSKDIRDLLKTSHTQHVSSSSCLTPQQTSINDIEHFAYVLRAGCIADSNKCLDSLLVWLSDQRTASYFNLKCLPGLFNAIMEQYTGIGCFVTIENSGKLFYLACLYELFGHSFLQPSPENDCYVNWFLQSKLRINDGATGPNSNQQRLESLFFGTHRYILKRLLKKPIKPRLNKDIDNLHQNSSSSPSDSLKFGDDCDKNQASGLSYRTWQRHRSGLSTNKISTKHRMSSINDLLQSNDHQQILNFHSTIQQLPQGKSIDDDDNKQHTDRYHSIMTRCSCLTTILRDLSFIEENEYLANDRCLLDILERILSCRHQYMHKIFDYESDLHQQYVHVCANCCDIIDVDETQLESSTDSNFQVYQRKI